MKERELRAETWTNLHGEFDNQNSLNHENIVQVFGWTKKLVPDLEVRYGIVMEYMDLGDLEGKIQNSYFVLNFYRFDFSGSPGTRFEKLFHKSIYDMGFAHCSSIGIYA